MARWIVVGCAVAALSAQLAFAQKVVTPTAPPPAGYVPPRTSWGAPSIEGMWTTNFILPMEASPRTPTLTLPEKDAQAMADLLAGEIAKSFDAQLDPE
ncbi:MAG: hypothetical protein EON93_09650, partial [Burkholderiales bacterium]